MWAKRANVEVVTRERGSDPASVCYDTIERAEARRPTSMTHRHGGVHTHGRPHARGLESGELVRKRSQLPVYTMPVTDATTGQNGLFAGGARVRPRPLRDLDAASTASRSFDGTAKGGIALAVP